MIVHRTNVVSDRPAPAIARGLLLLCLSLASLAQANVALYQVSVPLKGSTAADRTVAFGAALKAAAVRASGRREAGEAPAVAAAAADPTRFVQQYGTSADRMLKVGFDARAMEQLLQQARLPLWPAERPQTTVLLFVASVAGGNRAVTSAERPAERAEIERAAQFRGVPLAWPSESIDPATARARAAAAGATSAVLVGVPGSTGLDWTFGHAGQSAAGRGSLSAGVDLAADTLAARYAPGSTRGLETASVRVGGLDDVRAYAALTKYLEGLSLVRSVSLRELSGSTALLDIGLRGDKELLRRIAALDGRLVAAPRAAEGSTAEEPADFLWQP